MKTLLEIKTDQRALTLSKLKLPKRPGVWERVRNATWSHLVSIFKRANEYQISLNYRRLLRVDSTPSVTKLKSHVIEGVKTTRSKRLRKRERMKFGLISGYQTPPPPTPPKNYFYSAQGSFVAEMRFSINFWLKIKKRYNIERYDVGPLCTKTL